ncbi:MULTISPECIES: hypothetical protein [unclassified Streptomyces]
MRDVTVIEGPAADAVPLAPAGERRRGRGGVTERLTSMSYVIATTLGGLS